MNKIALPFFFWTFFQNSLFFWKMENPASYFVLSEDKPIWPMVKNGKIRLRVYLCIWFSFKKISLSSAFSTQFSIFAAEIELLVELGRGIVTSIVSPSSNSFSVILQIHFFRTFAVSNFYGFGSKRNILYWYSECECQQSEEPESENP